MVLNIQLNCLHVPGVKPKFAGGPTYTSLNFTVVVYASSVNLKELRQIT